MVALQARGAKGTGHTRLAAAVTRQHIALTALCTRVITLAGKAAHATLYIVVRRSAGIAL